MSLPCLSLFPIAPSRSQGDLKIQDNGTLDYDLQVFQKIGKKEHDEVLHHEAKMLVPKNEKKNLQKARMEITKYQVEVPKLQPQLTLHSFDK